MLKFTEEDPAGFLAANRRVFNTMRKYNVTGNSSVQTKGDAESYDGALTKLTQLRSDVTRIADTASSKGLVKVFLGNVITSEAAALKAVKKLDYNSLTPEQEDELTGIYTSLAELRDGLKQVSDTAEVQKANRRVVPLLSLSQPELFKLCIERGVPATPNLPKAELAQRLEAASGVNTIDLASVEADHASDTQGTISHFLAGLDEIVSVLGSKISAAGVPVPGYTGSGGRSWAFGQGCEGYGPRRYM